MASGLLSLKWNNHQTTFFHVLSTVRSKESYCDVTLACDGKFYPVHKLVLSTCSDYFENMFQRTNCKHPIIVLKDIRHEELEALLNYMYVGEVNVLQNELAGLIKAAECLMIKGLAVPDEAPTKETKRTRQSVEDSPRAKRRRRDDDRLSSPTHNKNGREPPSLGSSQSQRQSSSASIPSQPVGRIAPPPVSPSASAGNISDKISEACNQSEANEESSQPLGGDQTTSQTKPVTEVIIDEPGVKEEPVEIEEEVTETKESFTFDSLQEDDSLRSDPGGGGSGGFDGSQMLPTQPQSMEDVVAQAIPGSSGMQGNSLWEGDGSLQSFPMEGFSEGSRPPQMECGKTGGIPGKKSVMHDPKSGNVIPKPKVCPFCGYKSYIVNDLRKHIRTHTGEKPYTCAHCVYQTAQSSNLKKHYASRHPEISWNEVRSRRIQNRTSSLSNVLNMNYTLSKR